MRNTLFLVIAASLMSTSLCAQDISFDSMDSNGDGKVTQDEYHGRISDWGTYSEFDKDGDGYLTSEEFAETNYDSQLYDDWDVNNDGQLDKYEYYEGVFEYYDEN
ncbi:MAG: EF-hand domain-containing protein, partial [Oleiphilaceae bacterium]|nr:EF-hand domain-containing protein [Oleiphilaceae bacterium]